RRPGRGPGRARGEGAAAHRPQRSRRRDHRALARAGRRHGSGRRPARPRVHVRGLRRRRRRRARHVGDRRHLSEGAGDRDDRGRREERRVVQAGDRETGGRLHTARGSARRADADAARGRRRGPGGEEMRAPGVIVAVAGALALQTTLARFLSGGTVAGDLVLVAVVFVALASGPGPGRVAGTFAGLVQDALSSGIIGIGGLAKTIVGFLSGVIGTQFIVTNSIPRFVVFLGATVLHAVVFMGLYVVLDLRHFGTPYAAVAG